MAEADGPPVATIPERLDRKLRLGPFPSSRAALKFVVYAAIGALLAPFVAPLLWVPVVLVGFLLSAGRAGGEPLDNRLFGLVRWRVRSWSGGSPVIDPGHRPVARRSVVRLGPSRYLAVVRTGGAPLSYLPPEELARSFDRYRELLRGLEGSVSLLSTSSPICVGPFVPRAPDPEGPEGIARGGYRELVELIARRRSVRRVYLSLESTEGGPEGLGRLEAAVAGWTDGLAGLGLAAVRLRDRELAEAAHRLRITVGGPPP